MLTDLLTSANKKEIKPKTHSIPYLIQEVLMTNKDRLQLKNITVTRNHSTEDFKINLNSFKVKLALTNIIINAIEAMGRQVVMASDNHPKMIEEFGESLVNRFVSGMVVRIDPPVVDPSS